MSNAERMQDQTGERDWKRIAQEELDERLGAVHPGVTQMRNGRAAEEMAVKCLARRGVGEYEPEAAKVEEE
jgi:hypothetical protein